jgi:hypothetical protein
MVRVSFRLLLLKQQNSKIRMQKQLSMEPHKMTRPDPVSGLDKETKNV